MRTIVTFCFLIFGSFFFIGCTASEPTMTVGSIVSVDGKNEVTLIGEGELRVKKYFVACDITIAGNRFDLVEVNSSTEILLQRAPDGSWFALDEISQNVRFESLLGGGAEACQSAVFNQPPYQIAEDSELAFQPGTLVIEGEFWVDDNGNFITSYPIVACYPVEDGQPVYGYDRVRVVPNDVHRLTFNQETGEVSSKSAHMVEFEEGECPPRADNSIEKEETRSILSGYGFSSRPLALSIYVEKTDGTPIDTAHVTLLFSKGECSLLNNQTDSIGHAPFQLQRSCINDNDLLEVVVTAEGYVSQTRKINAFSLLATTFRLEEEK